MKRPDRRRIALVRARLDVEAEREQALLGTASCALEAATGDAVNAAERAQAERERAAALLARIDSPALDVAIAVRVTAELAVRIDAWAARTAAARGLPRSLSRSSAVRELVELQLQRAPEREP